MTKIESRNDLEGLFMVNFVTSSGHLNDLKPAIILPHKGRLLVEWLNKEMCVIDASQLNIWKFDNKPSETTNEQLTKQDIKNLVNIVSYTKRGHLPYNMTLEENDELYNKLVKLSKLIV